MRFRQYLFTSALALLPCLVQAQTPPTPFAVATPFRLAMVEQVATASSQASFSKKSHSLDLTLPPIEWHAPPIIPVLHDHSWERRIEKLYKPRFDRRLDQRVIYMPESYGTGSMEGRFLHNEMTERAVEKLSGRVASELVGKYDDHIEEFLDRIEDAANEWLKRRKLVYDSDDYPKLFRHGDSLKTRFVINFNIDNPLGVEGEYWSRVGKFDFSCFPDQAELTYRLLHVDGSELYVGLYQSFERDDRGLISFIRLPIASLLGREEP